MNCKDFRNVLMFINNRWDKNECSNIFNGFDSNDPRYLYSFGWHIWNNWVKGCSKNGGPINNIGWFLTVDLDNESLQKLINRSLEYYNED